MIITLELPEGKDTFNNTDRVIDFIKKANQRPRSTEDISKRLHTAVKAGHANNLVYGFAINRAPNAIERRKLKDYPYNYDVLKQASSFKYSTVVKHHNHKIKHVKQAKILPEEPNNESIPNFQDEISQRIKYLKIHANKMAIGDYGEALVMRIEAQKYANNDNIIVRHTSKLTHDKANYDIDIYDKLSNQVIRAIEVKATSSTDATQPFEMSANEVKYLKDHPYQYILFRIYNASLTDTHSDKYFEIDGPQLLPQTQAIQESKSDYDFKPTKFQVTFTKAPFKDWTNGYEVKSIPVTSNDIKQEARKAKLITNKSINKYQSHLNRPTKKKSIQLATSKSKEQTNNPINISKVKQLLSQQPDKQVVQKISSVLSVLIGYLNLNIPKGYLKLQKVHKQFLKDYQKGSISRRIMIHRINYLINLIDKASNSSDT